MVWALLAATYAQVGQPEEGLSLLTEALTLTNDREERRWEAELYRLQSEVLLARDAAHDTEAEACFRQALDIAATSRPILGAAGGDEPEPAVAAPGQAH